MSSKTISKDYNPSRASITKAQLFSYFADDNNDENGENIIPFITGVSFVQSMGASGFRGSIEITNYTGLVNRVRGEEKLILHLKGFDYDTEVKLKLQIYKITGVQPTKNLDGASFIMQFVSNFTYEASKLSVTEPFEDKKASYIAKKIFRKYYRDFTEDTSTLDEQLPFNTSRHKVAAFKKAYFQDTEGQFRVVIPNYTPGETMDFLCKKSYSTQTPSSMFRFFETFRNFYFVTDEFLITKAIKNPKQIIEMVYNPYTSRDIQDPLEQINAIESFSNPSRVDTVVDMYSGGYKNIVGQIDLGRRDYTEKVFSYKDDGIYYNMKGNQMEIADSIHTEQFMDETFTEDNAPQFMVFRDYRKPGDPQSRVVRGDQYYAEIASRRVIWNHHISTQTVTIDFKGRLDIEPGMVINVSSPAEFTVDEDEKKKIGTQYGGNYLVYSISHSLKEEILSTSATLYKFDWS